MVRVLLDPTGNVVQGQHRMSTIGEGTSAAENVFSPHGMHTHVWLGNVQRFSLKERPKIVS